MTTPAPLDFSAAFLSASKSFFASLKEAGFIFQFATTITFDMARLYHSLTLKRASMSELWSLRGGAVAPSGSNFPAGKYATLKALMSASAPLLLSPELETI